MRRLGLTRVFGNPGSTEIPFLTDFPADLEFVLGLHEGAVVGMASGYALGTGRPAFVNLHTAAGLGNAVNAIACARDNRIPLVIVVGQQDRRQLSLAPFLTGRNLERLAGDYPVWTTQPGPPERSARRGRARLPRGRRQARPRARRRADGRLGRAGRRRLGRPRRPDPPAPCAAASTRPPSTSWPSSSQAARVAGAGRRRRAGHAGGLGGASSRSPSGSPAPSGRTRSRAAPGSRRITRSSRATCPGGAAACASALRRQRPRARRRHPARSGSTSTSPGRSSSRARASPSSATTRTRCSAARATWPCSRRRPPSAPSSPARLPQRAGAGRRRWSTARRRRRPPAGGEPLRAAHVVAALAERLPADAILVEEAPSNRAGDARADRDPRAARLRRASRTARSASGSRGAIGLRMALPGPPGGRPARRRLVDVLDPGALERRALRRRRRCSS